MSDLLEMYMQKTNGLAALNTTPAPAKPLTVLQQEQPKTPLLQKDTFYKNVKTTSQKAMPYVLSGGISAAFGMLHGVYQKAEKTEHIVRFIENPKTRDKLVLVKKNPEKTPYEKTKIALAIQLAQPIENKDVKIAIETYEHHKKVKILLNPNDSIDKLFNTKNEKIQLMLKDFLGNGFNPEKESLLEFLSCVNIDEFNKNNKMGVQIKFKDKKGRNLVQFIDGKYNKIVNKGWKILPSGLKEVSIDEKGWLELPPEIVALVEPPQKSKGNSPIRENLTTKYAVFKKILNPYDEKAFGVLDKLPLGKKFTDFMRKTNSPIKNINLKPFNKLFYDKTSVTKGATVAALVGVGTYSLIKVVKDIYQKHKK